MARVIGFFLLPVAVLCTGCFSDVPHDNPLDPQSPMYRPLGAIRGRVTRLFSPYEPVADALVILLGANKAAITDGSGQFQIEGLDPGEYQLAAQKPGFAPDTVIVRVGAAEEAQVTIRLNALPVFEGIEATTVHVSRWWPPDDLYLARFRCQAYDPDEPQALIFVHILIPSLAFMDSLTYVSASGTYEGAVTQEQLPSGNLQDLLGQPIYFRATDRSGQQNNSDPVYLV